MGFTGWLELVVFPTRLVALSYGLPLVMCLWLRDKRLLWALALGSCAIGGLKTLQLHPPAELTSGARLSLLAARLVNVGVLAGVLHAILNLLERLRAKQGQLETANQQLAARDKEIQLHHEELRAQSEELTVQNEALRRQAEQLLHINQELHQREVQLQTALEALRHSETQAHQRASEMLAIMEALPAIVFVAHDLKGERLTSNRAGCELLGVAPDANISLNAPPGERMQNFCVTDLNGRPFRAEELPVHRAAASGQPVRDFEMRLRFADGASRDLCGHAVPLCDDSGRRYGAIGTFIDITERKQAEAALQENRRLLDLTLDAADMGTWWFTFSTHTCELGKRAQHLYGLSSPQWTYNLQDMARLIHPEDLDGLRQQAHAACASGGTGRFQIDYRVRRPEGGWRWLRNWGLVEFRAEGQDRQPFRIVGATRDITARKHAEQALRQSEARFRSLFENSLDAMFMACPDGTVLAANPMACQLFGMTQEELCQAGRQGLVDPADPQLGPALEDRIQKGKFVTELGCRRKDGSRFIAEVSSVLLNEEPARSFVVIHDISRRKAAEAQLKAALARASEGEHLLKALLDFLPEGIAISKTPNAQVCRISRSGVAMCSGAATPPPAAAANPPSLWNLFQPDGLTPLAAAAHPLARAVQKGDIIINEELVLGTADGQRIPVSFYAGPICDETGRIQGGVAAWRNISAQKEAQQALLLAQQHLRQHAQILENAMQERTAKLQELVDDLEHFSYCLTHDMRAPLRSMRGYAEIVNELCSKCSCTQQKAFLQRIMTSAKRMDALIRDALNYSRTVRQQLPLETVDSAALLRGILESYPELQPHRERIHLQGNLPLLCANEAGLTQCFSNLLTNAIKFTQPDRLPEITIRAERHGSLARIWIEDHGIGIPQSMLPRVFDMFCRAQTHYAGTGIGLALVRKVITRMGGRVGIESQEGKGSRFWFELSLAHPDGPAAAG